MDSNSENTGPEMQLYCILTFGNKPNLVKPCLHMRTIIVTNTKGHDIFSTWSAAQTRLWENLSNALSALQPTRDASLPEDAYQRHLAAWESAVEQALAMQKAWLEEWTANVQSDQEAPNVLIEWNKQVETVMHSWIESQNQLWQDWFKMLRENAHKPAAKSAPRKPAAVKPAAEPPPPAASKPDTEPAEQRIDDLTAIKGVGPKLAQKLNARGLVNYRQIASLTAEQIKQLEAEVIKFHGRIERDDWIGQTKQLHQEKYNETL